MILFAAKVSEVGGLVLLFSYLLEDIVCRIRLPISRVCRIRLPISQVCRICLPIGQVVKKVRRARDDTLLLFFFFKC